MDKEQWQKKGEGHRGRLRDRFLNKGLDGFSDIEVLELLLSFGTPRSDCKEQARNLLERFGTFAKVIETSPDQLKEIKGVGIKNSFALSFVHAVARYYLKERLAGKKYLQSSQEVLDYLRYSLRGLKKEVLVVIFLDTSHAIIVSEIVAEGTLNVNTVYPREIIKKGLGLPRSSLSACPQSSFRVTAAFAAGPQTYQKPLHSLQCHADPVARPPDHRRWLLQFCRSRSHGIHSPRVRFCFELPITGNVCALYPSSFLFA